MDDTKRKGGEAVNTASRNGRDQRIFQLTDGNMGIGGVAYTSGAYDTAYPDMKPFKGMIDDFSLWARPLVQEDTVLSPSNAAPTTGTTISWSVGLILVCFLLMH